MRYEEEVFPDIVASRLAISVSNANLLVRAMNATVEKIGGIGVSDGVMLVELENYKIWVKCEDYSSCDFDVILDEGYKSTVSIDANVLISMLGHIKNVLKSEYVEVKTSSNGVKLNIGRDVEKVFNVQYLIDMLKPVSDQMVELCCFSDNGGGCVSVTADGGKYRAVVMG
jgi:DNA polymerase III sliding clamp (beta) subunit (PCNA family)